LRLPEEQRAAILLVGVEGFTYQQVADILGIPTGTVRSRISRGRDALRDLMNAEPAQPADLSDGDGYRRIQPHAHRRSHTRKIARATWPLASAVSPASTLRPLRPVNPVGRPYRHSHVSH